LKAGWDKLVKVLDNGHYVRYDFSTATKLLEICKALKREYGNLTRLIKLSKNASNLSRKLQEFKGIGPTTARIFIRDLKRFKVI
jgi:transposase